MKDPFKIRVTKNDKKIKKGLYPQKYIRIRQEILCNVNKKGVNNLSCSVSNKKIYKKVSNLMKEASHLSTEADKKHKEFVNVR